MWGGAGESRGAAALKALLLYAAALLLIAATPFLILSLSEKGGRGGYRRKGPYTISLLTLRSMAGMIWYYTAEVVVVEGTRPHRCFLLLETEFSNVGHFSRSVSGAKRG